LEISELNHVQITVESQHEPDVIRFYRDILRLPEIEKPAQLQKNGGAWFRIAGNELHVSPEKLNLGNEISKRHVCFVTTDIDAAKTSLVAEGIEIIPDKQPIAGWTRFYLRDPGGNRIEIAQRTSL
jgi:catechol 2,3-dioxygenase-like lactoylglutathione lyase family enzyme